MTQEHMARYLLRSVVGSREAQLYPKGLIWARLKRHAREHPHWFRLTLVNWLFRAGVCDRRIKAHPRPRRFAEANRRQAANYRQRVQWIAHRLGVSPAALFETEAK